MRPRAPRRWHAPASREIRGMGFSISQEESLMSLGPRLGRLARRTRCAPALLALVLLLSLPHPVTADLTLSSTDERPLRQGRTPLKSGIPAGGSAGGAMGGTALALLQADPDTVWRTLVDFPGHAGLFPRVKESAVLERGGDRTLVRYRVAVGPFAFPFPAHSAGSWPAAETTTSSAINGGTGRSSPGTRGCS